MKEIKHFQNAYQKHKDVLAAQGVKIIAKELDHALAGLPLYVAKKPDEVDVYKVGFYIFIFKNTQLWSKKQI